MPERHCRSFLERLLQLLLAAGAALAAAGILIDVVSLDLPVQLAGAAGGMAPVYLGGGLTMVAATSLAGCRLFTGEDPA